MFIQNKDGALRLCVYYHALNKLTVKNKYPIPRLDDLLDQLQGSKMFSLLDFDQRLSSNQDHAGGCAGGCTEAAFTTPLGTMKSRCCLLV